MARISRDRVGGLIEELQGAGQDFSLRVGGSELRLTSLDRVFWPAAEGEPAVTKRDLIAYYLRVGEAILPHLKDRPLAFVRHPEGLAGRERFFQKHWDKGRPEFVEGVLIWSSTNDEAREWLMCNNLPTLLWLAQIASLEIHAWYSRASAAGARGRSMDFATSEETLDASTLNFPDFMVFDLDPNLKSKTATFEAKAFQSTAAVALALRDLLAEAGLRAFLKTSGKTGLHLYVPLKRAYPYEELREIAEAVGYRMERERPEDVTMEWSVEKRPNKVFVDHNQNVRGKTLVSVYSTRPAPGATVSFPVEWDELQDLDPRDFTLTTVPGLLEQRGERWAELLKVRQTIGPALRAYAG